MWPVRDWLALVLGVGFELVWAVHMVATIRRGQAPTEGDWATLPAGIAALLGAVYAMAAPRPAGRHRAPEHSWRFPPWK